MKNIVILIFLVFLAACSSSSNQDDVFSITIDGTTKRYTGETVKAGSLTAPYDILGFGLVGQGNSFVSFSDANDSLATALIFELPASAPTSFTEQTGNYLTLIYYDANNNIFDVWFGETISVTISEHGDRIKGNFSASLCPYEDTACDAINVSGEFDAQKIDAASFTFIPQ